MDDQSVQHIQPALREEHEDWPTPRELDVPPPTYRPAMLALGMVLLVWGFVTSWWITAVGAIVGAFAIHGWVRELIDVHRA